MGGAAGRLPGWWRRRHSRACFPGRRLFRSRRCWRGLSWRSAREFFSATTRPAGPPCSIPSTCCAANSRGSRFGEEPAFLPSQLRERVVNSVVAASAHDRFPMAATSCRPEGRLYTDLIVAGRIGRPGFIYRQPWSAAGNLSLRSPGQPASGASKIQNCSGKIRSAAPAHPAGLPAGRAYGAQACAGE